MTASVEFKPRIVVESCEQTGVVRGCSSWAAGVCELWLASAWDCNLRLQREVENNQQNEAVRSALNRTDSSKEEWSRLGGGRKWSGAKWTRANKSGKKSNTICPQKSGRKSKSKSNGTKKLKSLKRIRVRTWKHFEIRCGRHPGEPWGAIGWASVSPTKRLTSMLSLKDFLQPHQTCLCFNHIQLGFISCVCVSQHCRPNFHAITTHYMSAYLYSSNILSVPRYMQELLQRCLCKSTYKSIKMYVSLSCMYIVLKVPRKSHNMSASLIFTSSVPEAEEIRIESQFSDDSNDGHCFPSDPLDANEESLSPWNYQDCGWKIERPLSERITWVKFLKDQISCASLALRLNNNWSIQVGWNVFNMLLNKLLNYSKFYQGIIFQCDSILRKHILDKEFASPMTSYRFIPQGVGTRISARSGPVCYCSSILR